MKKITLSAFLLLSAYMNAQDTFAIYTENESIEAGVNHLRFSNGQGFELSEATTAPYEGTENYLLTFNGTSSYFHAILFPRDAANENDVAVDLSTYTYYNIAIKTDSETPFYVRMRGNNIIAKVLIDAEENSYGFDNDNEWHFLTIPIADFIPESDAFDLTSVTEILVLRSNTTGTTAGSPNDFEIDNVYTSVDVPLSVKNNSLVNLTIYPNPAKNLFTVNAAGTIDTIYIYNLTGQKVMEIAPANTTATADISSLQSGVYMVTIASEGKTATHKLVKH